MTLAELIRMMVSSFVDGDAREDCGSLLARVTVTSRFGGSIQRSRRPEGLDVEMSSLAERLKG